MTTFMTSLAPNYLIIILLECRDVPTNDLSFHFQLLILHGYNHSKAQIETKDDQNLQIRRKAIMFRVTCWQLTFLCKPLTRFPGYV
jgi:hypothetical protein